MFIRIKLRTIRTLEKNVMGLCAPFFIYELFYCELLKFNISLVYVSGSILCSIPVYHRMAGKVLQFPDRNLRKLPCASLLVHC
jgi:hypothetical protein